MAIVAASLALSIVLGPSSALNASDDAVSGSNEEAGDVTDTGSGLRVRTNCGWVRGAALRTKSGRTFRAFRGIPYAEPPVGERRFRPPRDKIPWEGALDAHAEGAPCLQVSHLNLSESGAEDCLYLNVYTPLEGHELPVLVYMHGGSFLEGHGGFRFVEPYRLLEHDLVLVSFNYRLGPFGFLSTEDAAMPGNYGLKDALSVLRWVGANAEAFGGDGARVTLAGASAGAAAVHLLALSPAAAPLLRGALLSSGGALARWAVAPRGTVSARRVAPLVGCDAQLPSTRLTRCLRAVDARLLLRTYRTLRPAAVPPLFAPVVETHRAVEADGDVPLLVETPAKMAQCGARVPLLIGITADESLEWGRNLYAAVRQEAFEDSFLDEELAKISPVRSPRRSRKLVARLRRFYLGASPTDNHLFSEANASALFSDALFNYPAYHVAALQGQASCEKESAPVFFYVFAFPGRVSETARRNGGPVLGVVHGDDLLYVLGRQYPAPEGWPNASEAHVAEQLTRAWATFATEGTPRWDDVIWEAVGGAGPRFRYLEITERSRLRKGPPFSHRMKFWETLQFQEALSHSSVATVSSLCLVITTCLSVIKKNFTI